MPTVVEIDLCGRWDALALADRLVPYRSHLVQRGRETWRVYAEVPGSHGEELPSVVRTIATCVADRGICAATVRVDDR